MDVWKDFVKAVSKQWTVDGVVMPTNVKYCVFVTNVVYNLDESGRYKFHGTAKALTRHLTHDKIGKDAPPLKLDFLQGVNIQLPDDYAIVPHIDEYADDVTSLDAGLPVESWLQDAHQVVKRSDWQKHVLPTLGSSSQQTEDNQHQWLDFPIFHEKISIDSNAEIGHTHDPYHDFFM